MRWHRSQWDEAVKAARNERTQEYARSFIAIARTFTTLRRQLEPEPEPSTVPTKRARVEEPGRLSLPTDDLVYLDIGAHSQPDWSLHQY